MCRIQKELAFFVFTILSTCLECSVKNQETKYHTSANGGGDFQDLITKNEPIVDKSLFIKAIMEDPWEVIQITRPRRFGKSINLSMLRYFLSLDYRSRKNIFENFSIDTHTEFCNRYKNKIPVILINFAELGVIKTIGEFKKKYQTLVSHLFDGFSSILKESKQLDDFDKETFKKFASGNVSAFMEDQGIQILMLFLQTHYHGQKVVVLLDGYDTLIYNAYLNGFYTEMVAEIRRIFHAVFVRNAELHKGVIMGETEILVESRLMDSWINKSSVYVNKFDEYFGFSEAEVEWLASKYGFTDQNLRKRMKSYYGGYRLGAQTLYNPGSVIKCLSSKGVFESQKKTVEASILNNIMTQYGALPIIKAHKLLQEGEIVQILTPSVDLTEFKDNEHSFWSLIVQLGFLTFRNVSDEDIGIKLTNLEVKPILEETFMQSRKKLKIVPFEEFVSSIKSRSSHAESILSDYLNRSIVPTAPSVRHDEVRNDSEAINQSISFYFKYDVVNMTTEIMKCLDIEFGPVNKIIVGHDNNTVVMKPSAESPDCTILQIKSNHTSPQNTTGERSQISSESSRQSQFLESIHNITSSICLGSKKLILVTLNKQIPLIEFF